MVPPEPDGHRSISASSSGARCSEGGLPMSRRCRPGEWEAAGTNGAYRAEQEVQYRCIEEYGAGA